MADYMRPLILLALLCCGCCHIADVVLYPLRDFAQVRSFCDQPEPEPCAEGCDYREIERPE